MIIIAIMFVMFVTTMIVVGPMIDRANATMDANDTTIRANNTNGR